MPSSPAAQTALRSYYAFDRYLGLKAEKPLMNNTVVRRDDVTGDLQVILHGTAVVTWHYDDTVTYRTGGYATRTTQDRINRYGHPNHRVSQRQHEWFITFADTGYAESFDDGGTYSATSERYFGGTTHRPVRVAA